MPDEAPVRRGESTSAALDHGSEPSGGSRTVDCIRSLSSTGLLTNLAEKNNEITDLAQGRRRENQPSLERMKMLEHTEVTPVPSGR